MGLLKRRQIKQQIRRDLLNSEQIYKEIRQEDTRNKNITDREHTLTTHTHMNNKLTNK